jgi:hypothetical protein
MDDIYTKPVIIDKIMQVLRLFEQQEYFGTRKMKNIMKWQLFF